jgi:ubiquinone/menaquinone biosynthesis C-methylase UbiE
MAHDLEFGKRVYDWLGEHPRIYKAIRWSVCLGRERRLQQIAIDAAGLAQGDTVLDLASGAGVNHSHLEAKVGDAGKIIAVDYSSGMLDTGRARAIARGWENIEFIQADAAKLSVAPSSLDGAICTFGLSAMPGESQAIKRVAAALKPGACFVVLDAKPFTGWARIFNPITGPLFKHTTNWDYEKDVIRSIRQAFGDVQLKEFNSGCNFLAVAKNPLV